MEENMQQWSHRNCPLCGNNSYNPKPEMQSRPPAESMSWADLKEYFIGLRRNQIFFSYHRCSSCGLLYCPYYFSQEQLQILYASMPDNLMGEDKSIASKTQSGYVKLARKFTTELNPKSYIEIGPDIGLVANAVDQIFELSDAFLVEPNKASHAELSRSMPRTKNVHIAEYLEQIPNANAEIALGVHVYDHMLDPISELMSLRCKLTKESLIVIVVHNEKSLLRLLLGRKWPPFCLQHPQLFNSQTIMKLFPEVGPQESTILRTTNWVSLQNVSAMLFQIFGFNRKPPTIFPNLQIPIKYGNIAYLGVIKEQKNQDDTNN